VGQHHFLSVELEQTGRVEVAGLDIIGDCRKCLAHTKAARCDGVVQELAGRTAFGAQRGGAESEDEEKDSRLQGLAAAAPVRQCEGSSAGHSSPGFLDPLSPVSHQTTPTR